MQQDAHSRGRPIAVIAPTSRCLSTAFALRPFVHDTAFFQLQRQTTDKPMPHRRKPERQVEKSFRLAVQAVILSCMSTSSWTCRCGQVALTVAPEGGTRVVCYCNSCRGFATRLGASNILDECGGCDFYQVAPEAAQFVKGADKVAWTKMTDRGPSRWFTTCCLTPLANTLSTPAIPFLTLQAAYLSKKDMLPPIEIRVFRKFANGHVPASKYGQGRLLREFAVRSLKSRFFGGWRRNPLFDDVGKPIATNVLLPD